MSDDSNWDFSQNCKKNEGTTLSMSVPLLLKERVGKMES